MIGFLDNLTTPLLTPCYSFSYSLLLPSLLPFTSLLTPYYSSPYYLCTPSLLFSPFAPSRFLRPLFVPDFQSVTKRFPISYLLMCES